LKTSGISFGIRRRVIRPITTVVHILTLLVVYEEARLSKNPWEVVSIDELGP
jgi:hypothetical protein